MDAIQPYKPPAGGNPAATGFSETTLPAAPGAPPKTPPGPPKTPPGPLKTPPKTPPKTPQKTDAWAAEEPEAPGHVEVTRSMMSGVSQLMGCCWRNPVTGEIILKPEDRVHSFPNFYFVDLYRRPSLPTSLKELRGDPYLFKPVVLNYRTWIYHEANRNSDGQDEKSANRLLMEALSTFCIDESLDAGRSSPICRLAAPFLFAGLTRDEVFTAVAVCILACVTTVSYLANHPAIYRLERPLSLIFRLPFLFYLLSRVSFNDVLSLFGFVVCLLALLLDCYLGDAALISCYRWHCTYTVEQQLPKRLFICKRHGAAGLLLEGKERYVDERVCGFASWEPYNALITDIGGLLVELRPMTPPDWQQIVDAFYRRKGAVPYVGLDVLGPPGGQGVEFMDAREFRLFESYEKQRTEGETQPESERLTVEDF